MVYTCRRLTVVEEENKRLKERIKRFAADTGTSGGNTGEVRVDLTKRSPLTPERFDIQIPAVKVCIICKW